MKILSLRLKGYGRFTLGKIDLIELDFKQVHQIIIGTNGCGKSSLMSELSPLPPSSSDFPNGGYKEITIEENQKIYRLKSIFDKGKPVHCFTIDDSDNLNHSRTETEQKKLVQEHFGLTQALLDLFQRKILFTKMTSVQRRDWLMAISGMDFAYAMRLNAKAKEHLKETTGVVKNLMAREIDETNRLGKMRPISDIKVQIDVLRQDITDVMGKKSNIDPEQYSEGYLMQIVGRMRTESELILNQSATYPSELQEVATIDDLMRLQGESEGGLRVIESALQELYEKKQKTEALAIKMGEEITDLETFTRDTDELRFFANALLLEASPFFCPIDEASDISFITAIEENLSYLFSRYPDNSEKEYSGSNRLIYTEEQKALAKRMADLNDAIDSDRAHLKHMKGVPSVECPSCNTEFVPGVNATDIDTLTKRLMTNIESLNELNERYTEVCDYLVEFGELVQLRNEILRAMGDYSLTNGLKTAYLSMESAGATPRGLLDLLGQWMSGMTDSRLYMDTLRQIDDNDLAIRHAIQLETIDKSHRAEQVSDIDSQIDKLIIRKGQVSLTRDSLKTFITSAIRVRDSKFTLEKLFRVFDEAWDKHVSCLADAQLNAYLSEKQSDLALLEKELSDLNAMAAIISSLSTYRTESQRHLNASKILLETLSPTSGIIAEHISKFLNVFVGQMNAPISSVWTYDMVVMAPSLSEGEIDYKFPIAIANEKPKKDVAETSAAQADIINMAFVMAVMEFLDDRTFPLYLDEFGIEMDETHRFNCMSFIKSFVEQRGCTQMFMISHYIANHGVFTNAEICLLDVSNIVNKPAVYNKHVRIYG